MNHRLSTIVLSFLILVTSGVSGVAYAVPTFEWTPKSLTQTIGRGESKTVAVTFTASQNASNVVARVARELQPYIKVDPWFFQTVQQGAAITLNVTFSPTTYAVLGTYQGTVLLVGSGNKALTETLPVDIVVVASTLPHNPSIAVASVLSPVLPPDPGDAGKLTIPGIDSDGDGVRDDIQRYIALTYPASAKTRAVLTQFAKGLQATLLTAGSKVNALAATEATSNAQYCLWYLYELDGSQLWQELRAEYLNTWDRSRAYSAYGRLLNAEVFKGVPLGDQRKALCDFNPDTLPN